MDHFSQQEGASPQIKEALSVYEAWPARTRAEHVRMCRVVRLYKEEQRKIVMAFGPGVEAQQLRGLILEVMQGQDEWVFAQGRPPPGHMERLLSQWASEIAS